MVNNFVLLEFLYYSTSHAGEVKSKGGYVKFKDDCIAFL